MDIAECESVLALLSSMKEKIETAITKINNCSTSPTKADPINPLVESSSAASVNIASKTENCVTPAVSSSSKMNKQTAKKPELVTVDVPSGEMSRDAVKAQREAAKAAKAARKKGKGKSDQPAAVPDQTTDLPVAKPKPAPKVIDDVKSSPTKVEKQPNIKNDQKDDDQIEELIQNSKISATGDSSDVLKTDDGKSITTSSSTEEKSKAQLKSERRAIQEAQRAAKKTGGPSNENKVAVAVNPKESKANISAQSGKTPTKAPLTPGNQNTKKSDNKEKLPNTDKPRANRKRLVSESKMQTLFDHLPHSGNQKSQVQCNQSNFNPVFMTLGQKYANGVFTSSKERCIELLTTLRQFIKVYETPEGKDLKYSLAHSLKANLELLEEYRPFAVAMENAVEHFNYVLRSLQSESSDTCWKNEQEIKESLDEELEKFIDERITKAHDAIVREGKEKIRDGDVLLIFGCSELVWSIIHEAADNCNISFTLVIIRDVSLSNDSSKHNILSLINTFIEKRKNCGQLNASVDYIGITGLSNRIQTVTKVFLDAEALLTNGKVLARAGTSQIALMASEHNTPVLVCCETYKFCDKSPTDSFSVNELKLRTDLKKGDVVDGYDGYLKTPELVYDITDAELVTAVITDVDMLPSRSVPVVLRVQENRARNM